MTGQEKELEEVETTEEVEESGEAPFWLEEDEPESSESEEVEGEETDEEDTGSKGVPVSKHVSVKKKLKAKLGEQNEELERLRQENQKLKAGSQKPTNLAAPKRPRIADFGTDDEYEAALDAYEESKLEYQTQYVSKTHEQTQKLQQRKRQIEEAVDSHYDRADKVVQKHSINPDVYRQADLNVKSIIESLNPNNGEMIFNELVSTVGEGSEIAMFHIGRNKAASMEFENILRSDPSGLKAAVYLGRIAERSSGTKSKTSRAPKPAAQIRGDEAVSAKSSAAQRKWSDAHKKGNTQDAYNLKKAARAQGIDTSIWR